jgi:hypothetical protein
VRQLFVDGAWVEALDGRTFETKQIYVNPA